VFDRQATLSFTHENDGHTRWLEGGYKHLRQGSYLSGSTYRARFNRTGHGAFVKREWIAGGHIVSFRADADYLEYDSQKDNLTRLSWESSVRLVDISDGWRYAIAAGAGMVEEFGAVSRGSLSLFRDSQSSLYLISIGYSSRAPSLHELYLPEQATFLYGGSDGYADSGNPDLEPEQQVIGSVMLQLGSPGTNLAVTVTGGQIFDGIDWFYEQETESLLRFRSANGDVAFTDVTIQPRLQIKKFLSFLGGASYHYLDYDLFDSRAYSPEYEAFSGLELHVYWPQRLLDLFAYGEFVYTGPYDGYAEKDLGKNIIFNGRLSFAMTSYQMYFVFQNVFSTAYREREYLTLPGRYFYFGFEWDFLN